MQPMKLSIIPGKPFEIEEVADPEATDLSFGSPPSELSEQVAATIKEYLKSSQKLLEGELSHLRTFAPEYLADPGKTLVLHCEDGVVVRYDIPADGLEVYAASFPKLLKEVVPLISEQVIHCYADAESAKEAKPNGPTITLSKRAAGSTTSDQVLRLQVAFKATINPQNADNSSPPSKPQNFFSVRNSIELHLFGEQLLENSDEQGRQFMIRAPLTLPVGWRAIEAFPYPDESRFKPEFGRDWASRDILAAVVTKQAEHTKWQTLDPMSAARRQFGQLFMEYQALLESQPDREEVLQLYLREHPEILAPTQIQMWPKKKIGPHQTDFVFRTATNEFILVELERPDLPLFVQSGQPSHYLTHAQTQILDWKRYIEDNLDTVQRELGLMGISSNPNGLIVMGRLSSPTDDNRRMLTTIANQWPKLRIVTYDDILSEAKAVVENLLGPIWFESGGTEVHYIPH